MNAGIYCYIDTEKDNEIVYVGKDNNIDKNQRHKDHHQRCRYDDQQINRVLQNNPGRYEYKVLKSWKKEEYNDNLDNALEIIYINRYKPRFNFTLGGEGTSGCIPWNKGKKASPETRAKMSKAKSGKNNPMYGKKGDQHPCFGRKESSEHKKKIGEGVSRASNSTGFSNVSKKTKKSCKQGFLWRYTYRDETDKRKDITDTDISKLMLKVTMKDLPWRIVDIEKAIDTINNIIKN